MNHHIREVKQIAQGHGVAAVGDIAEVSAPETCQACFLTLDLISSFNLINHPG